MELKVNKEIELVYIDDVVDEFVSLVLKKIENYVDQKDYLQHLQISERNGEDSVVFMKEYIRKNHHLISKKIILNIANSNCNNWATYF